MGCTPAAIATGTRPMPTAIEATLNMAGDRAGMKKMFERVEHSHAGGGHGHEDEERGHHAREHHRQLELAGHAGEVAGEQAHEGGAKTTAATTRRAVTSDERRHDRVAEPPGAFAALEGQGAAEGGYERGAHGPLGEEVAHQIGHAERHQEGVHGVAGAEPVGQHLFPHQAEDAAGHRGRAGDAGRRASAERSPRRCCHGSRARSRYARRAPQRQESPKRARSGWMDTRHKKIGLQPCGGSPRRMVRG